MANSIALAKKYVSQIDEIYKLRSLTAVLDGNNDLVREGANANELVIPKLSMQGMGTYSRSTGYVSGDVTLTWETVACNYDRGRMFAVDYLDNSESMDVAFGRLANEFVRTQVAPDLDAFRFSTYAQTSGITTASAALSAGADVVAALRTAISTLDENEVSQDDRYLFITPTLHGLVDDLDTTKSRKVLERFTQIIDVPQTRFYSKITQYDGSTSGQEAGGYIKDGTNGKNLNFMVIAKSALIQFNKHVAPKIITPEANQTSDAWKYGYRHVCIADVYDNKVKGVYAHISTT